MKAAVRFTVEVDSARFALWDGCTLGEVRGRLIWELAADLSESPAIVQTGARLTFTYAGGQEVPVALGGRTLRQQLKADEDGKWA